MVRIAMTCAGRARRRRELPIKVLQRLNALLRQALRPQSQFSSMAKPYLTSVTLSMLIFLIQDFYLEL
jgi:hypothetical protein